MKSSKSFLNLNRKHRIKMQLQRAVMLSKELCICTSIISIHTVAEHQLNGQSLYSITICMLHYNHGHVSSINMPIFRRTNCIITASGIVTLCKRLYSMPDKNRLQSSLLSSGILYCTVLYRVTIPDAVIIQFVLLKMGMLILETCRGL